MQPESDKVCAIVVHLLLVMVTGTGLTLRYLILMMWEDLQTPRFSLTGLQASCIGLSHPKEQGCAVEKAISLWVCDTDECSACKGW